MQPPASNRSDKPTRKRLSILFLVFVSVIINYLDRSNIAVAAPQLADDLSLSPVQMGLIFSAFGWTYSALQIPGGLAVDMIRVRLLYPFILVAWSLATALQGLVNSFATLFACRMAVGAFEAPSFPCNNKIVTAWFPAQERASAIAVYTSGQFIGLAFLMPVLTLIQNHFGWRGLFVISGLIGIVWALVWYVFYREPDEYPGISDSELRHIRSDSTQSSSTTETNDLTKADFALVFTNRKLWGIYLGKFCLGGTLMFFLTWFPTYLVDYKGLGFVKAGFLSAIPFLAAFVGVLISGFTSDYLFRKGWSSEFARKAPIITGLLLSVAIVGADFTDDTFWVIFFMSVAFFGNGLSSIAWVFVSLLSPPRLIGLVGGSFNFISGLAGVIVPIVIGLLIDGENFTPALVFIAFLALLGAFSYLVLVGKLERIDINDHPAPQTH